MRVLNSLKNTSAGILKIIIVMPLGFIARAIFIQVLGAEYQGVNGLFTSIISILAVAELGIATAITFNMYQYIAINDKETIKSLIQFYKKCYQLIGGIVFALGLSFLFFIYTIVTEANNISESLYVIFFLFLLDTVFSYLFSYKRSILYAHQKNYIVSLMDLIYNIALNIAQVAILLITRDFLLFTLIRVLFRLLENGIINLIANKSYPYIMEKDVRKLDTEIKKNFARQIKGLLFHRVGRVIVLGIDGMLITRVLGLLVMGLYSNYLLVVGAVHSLFSQMARGVVASIGDLLIEQDHNKSFDIYKKLSLIIFWLYAFAAISIYMIMDSFITLWLGNEYVLPRYILLFMSLKFYIQGMRKPFHMFKEAAGVFYEDRYVPIIESFINFALSLLLINVLGLVGIILGTIISTTIVFVYTYPKFIYEPIFKRGKKRYFKEQFYYLVLLLIAFLGTVGIVRILSFSSIWINFIIHILICLLIPNLIFFVKFRRNQEFKYIKSIFISLVLKRK